MMRELGRAGLTVGQFSFGTAGMGNLYRPVSDEDAYDTVQAAWDCGVRYFDTAPHYGLGLAESRLGKALEGKPRQEMVISTKVGRILEDTDAYPGQLDDEGFSVPKSKVRRWDFSRDGIMRSLESSLDRLGLDRIDVVFLHDPDNHYIEALEHAFPALDELRSQGVITSYGAGMNQSAMLTKFVENTDLDVVMVAGRYSLLEQPALADLLPAATAGGVSVVAAGVFNSGLLAVDRPVANAKYNYEDAPAELLDRVNQIADLCESHGVTLPAAAAQFPFTHKAVSTVCLGGRSREQVQRNAALFSAQIPPELWTALAEQGFAEHAAG